MGDGYVNNVKTVISPGNTFLRASVVPECEHIKVEKTDQGYNITFCGGKGGKRYRFEGVQPGDVITRPFFITGSLQEQAQLKTLQWAIENGERKGLGHAMVFIGLNNKGQGVIIHGAPNAYNQNGGQMGIEYNILDNQIYEGQGSEARELQGNEFRIIRMSNDMQKREESLRFLRFHLWLVNHYPNMNLWNEKTPISAPIPLQNPVTFEGQTYKAYHQFTCVGAIILAYDLRDDAYRLMDKYSESVNREVKPLREKTEVSSSEWAKLGFAVTQGLLTGNPEHVYNLMRTMAPTGPILLELATGGEIKPIIVSP